MDTISNVKLNDGNTIPGIGFGTYLLNGARGVEAIISAISAGYRLIDSAFMYENEGVVGKAIDSVKVSRESLYVISKLPGKNHPYQATIETVEESLYRMGLEYLDLYLIHWPNPQKGLYVEAWKALIECQQKGYVKSIGVCNFLPEHIMRLKEETGILPSVNQVELHPYFNQKELIAWHEKNGIVTQSWSPLGRGTVIASEPLIVDIAEKYKKTPTQIVLRWHVQSGAVPIPKATSLKHQMENIDIFDFKLSAEDMARINSLSRPDGGRMDRRPNSYEEY